MNMHKVLDKNIGINKKYDIKSRDKINKVVIYYIRRDSMIIIIMFLLQNTINDDR